MFPFAVEAGIDPREYWLYTITELNMAIQGYKKRLATRAAMDYRMVDLVGISVSRIVDKTVKLPDIATAYPGLFEPGRSMEKDWRSTKDFLTRYAQAHNAKSAGVK